MFPFPSDLEGPLALDPHPSRRRLLFGLGAVPLATMLSACGGGDDGGASGGTTTTASGTSRLRTSGDPSSNTTA